MQELKNIEKITNKKKEFGKSELPSVSFCLSTPKMRNIEISAKGETVEDTKELMQFMLAKVKQVEDWVTVVDKDERAQFPFMMEDE
jgi:hypothetical protein